jgi:hypothetical protein
MLMLLLYLIDAWNQLLTPVRHTMDKLKHLVTAQERSSQSVSTHVPSIDHLLPSSASSNAAVANAPGNLRWANGFLLFGGRGNFASSAGSCPPCMLCVSIRHEQEAHSVTALLQNGDGISPPICFREHDRAKELFLLFRSSGGAE